MPGKSHSSSTKQWRPTPVARLLAGVAFGSAVLWGTVKAGDILRGGSSTSAATTPTTTSGTGAAATAAPVASGQDRLARTTQALTAVRQMQAAARALAVTGPNNLKANLPTVPVNSYLQPNGLIPALGVPKDLLNPQVGEDVKLWTGANLPTVTSPNGSDSTTVTIKQTEQQAVLNWQSFNIGKNTTLNFDQSAGGSNVGQWIAFNKVGINASPSQILGSIKADGQVYVINPNGIIFGGSSQVNTHALVASSLPINDNLIGRGLLNNPDTQFLFSALPLAGGANGTPAFSPAITDTFTGDAAVATYTIGKNVAVNQSPAINYASALTSAVLDPAVDYSLTKAADTGKTTITFTTAGLAKIAGATVKVSYVPAPSEYGNVEVQAGAQLTAPASADHIGGRVALVGKNVTNAGTISTVDGQTILAAGLQVGFSPHSADATLRGLDVYVGAVTDDQSGNTIPTDGVATNASFDTSGTGVKSSDVSNASTNPNSLNLLGLIEAPRGDVYITGRSVNQLGAINSSTSVTLNGRIDLVAAYDAIGSGGIANAPSFFLRNTGPVVFGAGSVTGILPELDSTDLVVGTTLPLPSKVNIQGSDINFGAANASNPGATLLAPSGKVGIQAGSWRFTSGGLDEGTGLPQVGTAAQFIYDGGSIVLGKGAQIDVAGSQEVKASVNENIILVQLRGPELANSPLQRDGPLRGQTVQIDIRQTGTYNGQPWVGTPLADAAGYVGLVQHSVGELTADGGSVTLNAGGAVNLQTGSSINVSGGWINYQGGTVQTTKLLSNGRVIDISQATPDQIYNGIFTGTTTTVDPKWGTTQTIANPLPLNVYEPGYTQGGNGGSLQITGSSMVLDGNMVGRTFPGARQRTPYLPDNSAALVAVKAAGIDQRVWELNYQPKLSELSLAFMAQYADATQANSFRWYSPNPPDIVFQSGTITKTANPRTLILSPDIMGAGTDTYGGFGYLTIDNSADSNKIDSEGKIDVPLDSAKTKVGSITVNASSGDVTNVVLKTAPGGSITFDAANITIQGGVVAPGGKLNFTAHDFWQGSTYNFSQFGVPDYDSTRGNFKLAKGAKLDATGLIVDDRSNSATAGSGILATDGGTIAIAGSNVVLDQSSKVVVNGGALIAASGKLTYGEAGAISLKAGADPSIKSITGGTLVFNTADQLNAAFDLKPLQGYSGKSGGTLSLVAPLIQVGNVAGTPPPTGTLLLSENNFSVGGFGSYSLTGLGQAMTGTDGKIMQNSQGDPIFLPAVLIAPGAVIHPRVEKLQIDLTNSGYGTKIYSPLAFVNTPVSLAFNAPGVTDPSLQGLDALKSRGDIVVGAGAKIETDAQTNSAGGVSFTGQTVAILGSVIAPGGTISIFGAEDSRALFAKSKSTTPLPTVDLGPLSVLSTAGKTVLTPDLYGKLPTDAGYLNSGSVLAGGNIAVSGNIVAEAGAKLDVSGWSDTKDAGGLLNLPPALSGSSLSAESVSKGVVLVPTVVSSNGGSIALNGKQELFVDATLIGNAGGSTATGGSLSISSGTFDVVTPLGTTLEVSGSGKTIAKSFYGPGENAIGNVVVDAKGQAVAGHGYFTAALFSAGGFDALTLKGTVEFKGPVNIAAARSLTAGTSGVIYADDSVDLSAPYVVLGQGYLPPVLPSQETSPFVASGGPFNFAPEYGTGTLSVTAGTASKPGLIDIGNLSLQKIGQANFSVTGGDVRGYGTFNIAGDVSMTAGQVYPVTAETFTIAAFDYAKAGDKPSDPLHQGSVTFVSSQSGQTPLSAGGTLNVFASKIIQGGNLRAPIGTINLGWDGTGTAPVNQISNTVASTPITQELTLGAGGTTSVSGLVTNTTDGSNLPIPYGLDLNGTAWIDPSGNDITNGGLPGKTINLQGIKIAVDAGSVVDTRGGGDLYAYQFVPGVGGTNDILSASSTSFAIVPGFQAAYAPLARFNPLPSISGPANLVANDAGYASLDANGNSRLAVGDQIHIDLQTGSGPGNYTLLPARYALLPGAFLITPKSGTPPSQPVKQSDGSVAVAGYRFNAFDPALPLYSMFEVAASTPSKPPAADAKPTVVQSRAQYSNYFANAFFSPATGTSPQGGPLIPVDSGQLTISAISDLSIHGSVNAKAASGGRGGMVDISSPENIVINDTGDGSASGTLYLSSTELTDFGAGSLLIGGRRTPNADGTSTVNVTANNITVDDATASKPLYGTDIILAANNTLNLAPGSVVGKADQAAYSSSALLIQDSVKLSKVGDKLTFARGGTAISLPQGTPGTNKLTSTSSGIITKADGSQTPFLASTDGKNNAFSVPLGSTITLDQNGSLAFASTADKLPTPIAFSLGDGALLRVGSDPSAKTFRAGVASSTTPNLTLGAGAKITGGSITLDSTSSMTLGANTILEGQTVNFAAGRIALQLDPAVALPKGGSGLVLTGDTLQTVQKSASGLSLLSYSSIDTYGSGTIGGLDAKGKPTLTNLALHAGTIHGDGKDVTFNAQNITLDNSPSASSSATLSDVTPPVSGTLTFNADNTQGSGLIQLGSRLADDAGHKGLNNQQAVFGYQNSVLRSSGGIVAQGAGGLNSGITVAGSLDIQSPLIYSGAGADFMFSAAGKLRVKPLAGQIAPAATGGLGGNLTLQGSSVEIGSGGKILLPSGGLTLHANGTKLLDADVSVAGLLDLGGTVQSINDLTRYTNGGKVNLQSDAGDVIVAAGGTIGVSAPIDAGDAGTLSVSAPMGSFVLNGTVKGMGGKSGGQNGTFSLDVKNLSNGAGKLTASLTPLETSLANGGFSLDQAIRVRNGDVVVDGPVQARTFILSADAGSIDVAAHGLINASGETGGTINLVAGNSVTLESGSVLDAHGVNFDNAGKGGTVSLEAGSATPDASSLRGTDGKFAAGVGVVDIEAGSAIDLSITNDHPIELNARGSSVTVASGTAIFLPDGTPGGDTLSFTSAGVITSKDGTSTSFNASATKPFVTTLDPGSTVALAGAATVAFESGTDGSIRLNLPSKTVGGAALKLVTNNTTDLSTYNSTGTLHLRAPQVMDQSGLPFDVRVNPVNGSIKGASSIAVEGFHVFDLTNADVPGLVDLSWQNLVQNNGAQFAGGVLTNADGTFQFNDDGSLLMAPGHTGSITDTLLANNPTLRSVTHVRPGAEIVNRAGDITLSSTWDFAAGAVYLGEGDPALAANWDLTAMTYRFGPALNEPGFLTLRAAGNLVLSYDPDQTTFGSLNDGFAGFDGFGNDTLWQAIMLPAQTQSWTFRLTAGSDLAAADYRQVLSKPALGTSPGSLLLGKNVPDLLANPATSTAQIIVPAHFQTIRTGTGDIDIHAGGDIQFLNNLATIYTAGSQTDPVADFDLPVITFPAQYSSGGGNVSLSAVGNIEHLNSKLAPESSKELPMNWLNRRGWVDPVTGQFGSPRGNTTIDSTSWWVDYSNFFEGVGALGGGNVTLVAGQSINNVDAVVPTNERTTKLTKSDQGLFVDKTASHQTVVELGGGDLTVKAGGSINGGVYYVERGQGSLQAGDSIHSNATRAAFSQAGLLQFPASANNPASWLPTTLFLGQGNFTVNARGDVLLGPVANPFLLPQSFNNGTFSKTYFSTLATSDAIDVSSLTGAVTLKDRPDNNGLGSGGSGSLTDWINLVMSNTTGSFAKQSQPWLRLVETDITPFGTLAGVMPSSLRATAFGGDINLVGSLTLSPSPDGQVELAATGAINGFQPNSVDLATGAVQWGSSMINLSDADPGNIPGPTRPLSLSFRAQGSQASAWVATSLDTFTNIKNLFAESGSSTGTYGVIQTKQALHSPGLLHIADQDPVKFYAQAGDISGLTLFAGKSARVVAGRDISDVALYVQNVRATDVTTVAAGRDINAYDPFSKLRAQVQNEKGATYAFLTTDPTPASGTPTAGDIQINGPGTLEVLAGGNIDLGVGPVAANGTSVGLTSIGNSRNPALPFAGANIMVAAGLGSLSTQSVGLPGLASTKLDFAAFSAQFVNPDTALPGALRYLTELAGTLGITLDKNATAQQAWDALMAPYASLSGEKLAEQRDRLALAVFYLVLRDAGRDRNNPDSPDFKKYTAGTKAIQTLFPGYKEGIDSPWKGNISLSTRLIETTNGGDISLLAPGGQVTVGLPTDPQKPDQGILSERGGNISIFARNSVNVGTSRIFTLRGGNEIIWSDLGNIAAGSGSKTLKTAPPTRVLIDPQSGDIQNDLAGLATGSGIGVLATLTGVKAGDVDLIAPVGTVDAGDAGIRSSGNLNIAALVVLNSSNIQVGGTTAGTPPPPPAPNLGAITAASTASAGASSSATEVARQGSSTSQPTELPSLISVEVLGYGGGDDGDSKDPSEGSSTTG